MYLSVRLYVRVYVFICHTHGGACSPPELGSSLAWVYGIRVRGNRRCASYTGLGEIAYAAGPVGVMFSRERNAQAYLLGHTADITAIDIHVAVRVGRDLGLCSPSSARPRETTRTHMRDGGVDACRCMWWMRASCSLLLAGYPHVRGDWRQRAASDDHGLGRQQPAVHALHTVSR